MINVSSAIEVIISRSRYLSEAISKGIINTSALARYIHPEVEDLTQKKVTETAIMIALNRASKNIKPKYKSYDIFSTPPDMIVRSNLVEITVLNSETLGEKFPSILKLTNSQSKHFLTVTEGVFETTIIASSELQTGITNILIGEEIAAILEKLSSITIRLPEASLKTPGIFYFFLKSLAWEGINVVEIVSAYLELTIIFDEKDMNKAFSVLQSLFTKKN